eukprot:CAMPEP_0174365614 /NCGR_PEP_ID=MMETSP0811_2-20130205/77834_1 /TAXON_ID=73025 ORGANISM="Eutreptiella gymnastica-like, Strain CCMP1594" /NCGR_SAMPLE_ID=MMETSP0811_2 /ASSEMBLY_ACC=CAM_ASM_000667 /LENGTH=44 /DNA_ID= /DNA_START= /DNA_END= /DNA_ORIENTATION=
MTAQTLHHQTLAVRSPEAVLYKTQPSLHQTDTPPLWSSTPSNNG